MSLPPPELHDLMRLLDKSSTPLTPRAAPVDEFIDWASRTHHGLLGFALDKMPSTTVGTQQELEEFDRKAAPRVSTRTAFAAMSAAYCPPHISPDEYLTRVVNEQYGPGTASPHDREARAFAATHFAQQGLHVTPDDVHVFAGGTKAALNALLQAAMTPGNADDYLVPAAGFDPAWHDLPGMSGGSTVVVTELNEAILRHDWIYDSTADKTAIVLYIPLVNSLTGEVLTRQRAHSIARAVLQYNRNRSPSAKPAYVLADDSAIDSYHTSVAADAVQPIGAVTGEDLGDATLGRMQDWTLTAVTPGPIFGLQDSDICFAVTQSQKLREALGDEFQAHRFTLTPPAAALVAAAALCLTPHEWIEQGNAHAVQNLDSLRHATAAINNKHGFQAVTVDKRTVGGRHTAIRLHPRLFPMPEDGVISDVSKPPKDSSHWAALKSAQTLGDLFKWHYSDLDFHSYRPLTLRVNLAVTSEEFAKHIERLAQCAITLASIYPTN
jgi:hypothetical protein